MKTFLFILFALFTQYKSSDLTHSIDEPVLYLYADILPRFCQNEGLNQYLYSTLNWPDKFDGQGVVLVSFIIDKNGKVKNIKIERSLCTSCDQEVIRVLENMPDWEPGLLNSVSIDVILYLPVEFKMKD